MHSTLNIHRFGQTRINFGRCIVAQPSEVDNRIHAVQNFRVEIPNVPDNKCGKRIFGETVKSVLAEEEPVQRNNGMAALDQLGAERNTNVSPRSRYQNAHFGWPLLS
jgi:hypothetical protein